MLGMPQSSTTSGLDLLNPTRRTLLVALKNLSEATTDQLAQETYLSPGAVRAHLLALESQGLVSYERLRGGPGRPRHMFRVTRSGEALFPQLYAEMANLLLAALEDEDPGVKERVYSQFFDNQVQLALGVVRSSGSGQRVRELADLVHRFGFFPTLETPAEGTAELTLRHCPLISVARNHPAICEVECAALSTVVGSAVVFRSAHRVAGDPVCTYTIQWPPPGCDAP
jgi:predicted ArsR family transcriptional regulator